MIISITSCQKEPISQALGGLTLRDESIPNYGDTLILGDIKINPYSVSRLNSEKSEVYNITITATTQIQPTYRYIRFRPQTPAQLISLGAMPYPVFSFPLDRTIISMGNTHYDNPDVPEGDLDYQFATVPIDSIIPIGINYDVLDELNYSVSDTSIVHQSYRIAGYGDSSIEMDELKNYEANGGGVWTGGGSVPLIESVSTLVSPADCSCKSSAPARQPAGCIRVWDSQKNQFVAARHVRIIALGPFGGWISTETNDYGCFKHPSRLFLRWFAFIEMHNEKCDIYDTRKSFWDIVGNLTSSRVFLPYKYFFKGFNGNDANHIDHDFELERDDYLERNAAWKALTINNAVYEIHQFCANNSLTEPQNHLRIMSHNFNNDGACMMMNRITAENGIFPTLNLGDDIFWYLSENNKDWHTTPHPPNVKLMITLLAPIAMWVMPDVVIGRQNLIWNGVDRLATDQIKELTYHELAHAIHYSQVGKDYWISEIEYTLANNGYGDGTADDAGRPAIVEAWANFIAPTITDVAYHTNSSPYRYQENAQTYYQSTSPIESSFIRAMEAFDPNLPGDEYKWIPKGILHDLRDIENLHDPSSIQDNVSNYTILQIFMSLQNTIASPTQFKAKLLIDNNNNQTIQVNQLFDDYGW